MVSSNKFGTFKGVFTPSILTILGVIMYMRLPMIVGEAGLFNTIGIIVIAHIISASTSLSVSSIATDKKVQTGGTYYMISRSLGLPIGGTLGLALFVGLSFSVSLYLIGFAESFLNYWGWEITKNSIRLTGTIILLVVTIITFISTSLALKTQYFIMAAILLSLLSIVFGNHNFTPEVPHLTNISPTVPLIVLFGIFFPAVTGFEAGVSMSGDLKDPKKSIPVGSISAVTIGFVVYIALSFFFSYTVDAKTLAEDPKVLFKIAYLPELVIAGIWGATLSSAFGSILGAPRILQATAIDKITPRIFAKGTGKTNEPRNALIFSFLIAEAGIIYGELNAIAEVVSIFFITTYGFLNLSAAFERWTSADFRPTFKPPAWISLIGALACFIVMIQLNFVAMIFAVGILVLLYLYLKRKELVLQSGDAWAGIWASLVKSGLKRLSKEKIQTRNWRPNIVMFSGDETVRSYMVEFGKDIAGRLGIITGFEMKVTPEPLLRKQSHKSSQNKTEGFYMNVHSCRDVYSGMDEVVRLYGFTGIDPNTVLMGWSRTVSHRQQFLDFIKRLAKNDYNSLFIDYKPQKGFGDYNTIDIWWSGWGNNISFALTILKHLTSSANWKDPKLRIFTITYDNSMVEILHREVEKILEDYRMNMEIRIINNSIDKLPVNDIIWRESENSALTILGVTTAKAEQIEKNYEATSQLIDKLGTTLMISASSIFESYSVVAEINPVQKPKSIQEKLQLPLLKESKYNEIKEEIAKIDTKGLEVLERFSEKTFNICWAESEKLVTELKNTINSQFKLFQKLAEQDSKNRKLKNWGRLKRDFYNKTTGIINKFSDEKLKRLKELLFEEIELYQELLTNTTDELPKKIIVPFDKKDFRINNSDRFSLKVLKLRKKIAHPFARKAIHINLNFRKVCSFYLKDYSYVQLNKYLQHFNSNSLSFIAALRDWILQFENQLNTINKEIISGELTIEKIDQFISKRIEGLENIIRNNSKTIISLKNEQLEEFRKNIQLLSNDLSKINANKIVKRKRRSNNYYRNIKDENSNFGEQWFENMVLYFNLINLDLQVFSLSFEFDEEMKVFVQQFLQQVDNNFLLKTKQFVEQLTGLGKAKNIPDLIIDSNFLQKNDFTEILHKSLEGILDNVPENMQIADIRQLDNKQNINELTAVQVPLKRVAKHFVSFLLASLIEVDLKSALEDIKSATYDLKDHLSFMYFELENIEPNLEIEADEVQVVLQEALKGIKNEENNVNKILEEFKTNIDKNTRRTFEALSPYRIVKSSKELSQSIREMQVSKGTGYFSKLIDDIKDNAKNVVLRILYSRSEGVLLARELNETRNQRSLSEQMLELLDKISLTKKINDAIPTFYKNLFSGRSSISEDFWIERPLEENMFEKAWERYRMGYHGAILIIGERNSGKTAFCRYATKKYGFDQKVYHVFPPAEGAIELTEFSKTLNYTTNFNGTIDEVFEKLPYQSVVVFNDFELWWESSENGLTIINELFNLIKIYGAKCFFIVNMNKYSYQYIKEFVDIDNYFISKITCQPFNSEELKELILRRHRAGGLEMSFGRISEDKIPEIRLAGIFNRYFNYSDGNPGLALFSWIASVDKMTGDRLYMKMPSRPNLGLFDKIDPTWLIILSQLIIHKRMDIEKLIRVLQIDRFEIEKNINAMLMSGLISEKTIGLYIVNPILDKFLSNYLHENRYL